MTSNQGYFCEAQLKTQEAGTLLGTDWA